MLIYTVTCELPTDELTDAFLDWLADDHLADVIRAGAHDAEATLLDPEPDAPDDAPRRVVCRYRFQSRDAFDAYVAGPAEALRREGRQKFGSVEGVRFSRTIGVRHVAR